ncbi:hypothetical protein CDCA_CDCA08G2307 [Cyanidium caldarium]|uniref:DNA mismatch repair proteins mutS family domain-containing protein n=1 Tax=Cyanidium caldarium TaxID=2771 RepID=A0AAV9IVB6_CYACA|nr:hypothetical protein CDCA_CDCA08G2307 [Cyanidium caldarium]
MSGCVTPLLRHWAAVRRRYPHFLLLYQVGDFYECFRHDAVTLSETLGVALTKRGVGEAAAPMAGIPVRSVEAYLQRLVRAGLRVALCDQVEAATPNLRRLVRRQVTRLVTPGTFTEAADGLTENNFLVAVAGARGSATPPQHYGVCWADVSTGGGIECSRETSATVAECLSRLRPREVVLRADVEPVAPSGIAAALDSVLQRALPPQCIVSVADESMQRAWASSSSKQQQQQQQQPRIDEVAGMSPEEVAAAETLLAYVDFVRAPSADAAALSSTADSPSAWPPVRRFQAHTVMRMDAATRRALELHRSWRDPTSRRGSLLDAIDATVTAGGARLLSMRLACPLVDAAAIERRLDVVEFFVRHRACARDMRRVLARTTDMERALQRLYFGGGALEREKEVPGGEAGGGGGGMALDAPVLSGRMASRIRDLLTVRDALAQALEIRDRVWRRQYRPLLAEVDGAGVVAVEAPLQSIQGDAVYRRLCDALGLPEGLTDGAVGETSARTAAEGVVGSAVSVHPAHVIRRGYSSELDAALEAYQRAVQQLSALEETYRQRYAARTLRVRCNHLHGWYVELSKREAARHPAFGGALPEGAAAAAAAAAEEDRFRRLGELSTTLRFQSAALSRWEQALVAARERCLAIQHGILQQLVRQCALQPEYHEAIRRTAGALSELDVAVGLAHVAHQHHYCRPVLLRPDAQRPQYELYVLHGRHATVERAVRTFVPNSCHLRTEDGAEDGAQGCANGSDVGSRGRDAKPAVAADHHLAPHASASPHPIPSLALFTSANASGKSTYLRQNALIVVLAQMGSFVPADACRLHPVDGVYARVGAAAGDDLVTARSTFYLEMEETAAILRHATSRSLVVLDEVGRGTSSEDGMAIGEAVACALAPRCRTLFATHYHELARRLTRAESPVRHRVGCITTGVHVNATTGALTFAYRVHPGTASKSYGIQVARLAGLPLPVVEHAQRIVRERAQTPAAAAC